MDKIDPDAKQLINLVKESIEINNYDYNKMMFDFEKNEKRKRYFNQIKKDMEKYNRNHQQRIKQMKENRIEQDKEKNKELQTRMKLKNQTMLTALDLTKQSKIAEKQKLIEELAQKEKIAKEIVERNLMEQEKQRLISAEKTETKIRLFNERNIFKKQKEHEMVVKKNNEIYERHIQNIAKLNEETRRVKRCNSEKNFRKYVNVYWNRRLRDKNRKEMLIQSNEKQKVKAELIEELEKSLEIKRQNILKRINKMNRNKEENIIERRKHLEENRLKREKYQDLCECNKQTLEQRRYEQREKILNEQSDIFQKIREMEKIKKMKKMNLNEKAIIEQMVLEKNIYNFQRAMNAVKSDSILKKSQSEKVFMYKEKKRLEYEEKKRLEEEKNNK